MSEHPLRLRDPGDHRCPLGASGLLALRRLPLRPLGRCYLERDHGCEAHDSRTISVRGRGAIPGRGHALSSASWRSRTRRPMGGTAEALPPLSALA